jgi:hypothetical protein
LVTLFVGDSDHRRIGPAPTIAPCVGSWNQTCDGGALPQAATVCGCRVVDRRSVVLRAAALGRTGRKWRSLLMSSRLLTSLFAATALFSFGCDDSTGLASNQAANVRVINASPATGTVDVLVNGTVQTNASGLPYRGVSAQCVRVDADNSGLTFQQTSSTVSIPPQTFTFDQGGRNTVIIAGTSSANLRVLTLSDPLTPELQPGFARIRVVNGRATTNMNVTVTPWDQPVGTPQAITATNNAAAATGWFVVPADEPVAINVTTAAGAFIDALNWIPTAGQELVIVATDPATGTAPLRWIVTTSCGRP